MEITGYAPLAGNYLTAIGIFILALILAKVVNFSLKVFAEKVTSKTKSILDDLLMRALIRPATILVIILGLFVALHFVPYMQPYKTELNQAFMVVIILLGAFTTTRLINAVFEWYQHEFKKKTKAHIDRQFLALSRKLAYIVVYVVAVVWILNLLGVEITALIAALGIGGLAIALALQDTLSNFFAGAHIIMDRPIKIGDYIELDAGDKGWVEDIGWRSTKIRTLPNNRVIIPNSKLAQSKITNFNAPENQTGFIIDCGVSYFDDLEKVERVTIDEAKKALKTIPGGAKEFEPFMRYREFGHSNINFSIIMRVDNYVDKYLITHEFIKALKKRYDKEGIEISFPARNVWMRK